ncbi:hypothetical protein [Paraburkholderia rhizosphaerae]|uniref:hypothetical protein n=1 Tax=Paraburkholderia rhizosphaerae TaxID=480658 RepID=UPI001064E6A3|nr:hypothetical protein [Paraburkholderia rhizosphaerae]
MARGNAGKHELRAGGAGEDRRDARVVSVLCLAPGANIENQFMAVLAEHGIGDAHFGTVAEL